VETPLIFTTLIYYDLRKFHTLFNCTDFWAHYNLHQISKWKEQKVWSATKKTKWIKDHTVVTIWSDSTGTIETEYVVSNWATDEELKDWGLKPSGAEI